MTDRWTDVQTYDDSIYHASTVLCCKKHTKSTNLNKVHKRKRQPKTTCKFKNCSHVCVYHCALAYTIEHTTRNCTKNLPFYLKENYHCSGTVSSTRINIINTLFLEDCALFLLSPSSFPSHTLLYQDSPLRQRGTSITVHCCYRLHQYFIPITGNTNIALITNSIGVT